MTEKIRLKKCPKCGTALLKVRKVSGDDTKIILVCPMCGFEKEYRKTKAKVIDFTKEIIGVRC